MAGELTISASMVYEDAYGVEISEAVEQIVRNISSKRPMKRVQQIGITEEAIVLPDAAPSYAIFRNLDPTNFVDLKVATGGAIFARLDPDSNSDGKGGIAILKLGSGAQAPFAIADTAACDISVMIVPA